MQAGLSETLVEFGAPVLEALPVPSSRGQLDAALGIIATIWNAYVLAEPAWAQPEDLERLVTLRESGFLPEPMAGAVATLGVRRRERFAGDLRFVSRWALEEGPDGVRRLTCETTLPPSAAPG